MDGPDLIAHDVLLRGVRLRYLEGGPQRGSERVDPGSPPSGATLRTPVMMLHGLARSGAQWTATARRLASDRRVICLDFPGFGDSEQRSSRGDGDSFEELAETTFDLLAALGLGRVALVGHSMGAGAAIVAAADRPEFVQRLVLVAPPCYATVPPLSERLLTMPIVGASIFRRLFGGVVVRRHVGETAENIGEAGAYGDATFAMLRRISHPTTLEARLPRIRAPTLVVWGRDDRVAPWTHGSRLAREIGARLEVLDCGHTPEVERPAAFASLVVGFLTAPRVDPIGVARAPLPATPPPARAQSGRHAGALPRPAPAARAPRRDR